MGIYLSAHPLDEFSVVLNYLCNTHCIELDDNLALAAKEGVSLGGIVTNVEAKMTKKGTPCGFVTIEDFKGSGRLALFGEEWGKWQGMLSQGYTVFIRGKSIQRFKDSNVYDFRISDIKLLQTVKNEEIEKITLTIESTSLDENMVNDLTTLIDESKGKTQLFFEIIDKEHNSNFVMRAKNREIDLSREFLSYIDAHPDITYNVN